MSLTGQLSRPGAAIHRDRSHFPKAGIAPRGVAPLVGKLQLPLNGLKARLLDALSPGKPA
jgi:hypothetical protein